MTIIKSIIDEALEKINSELSIINKDIEDFNDPITVQNLQEKIDSRLSSENLIKNRERKAVLDKQRYDLISFVLSNSDWVE